MGGGGEDRGERGVVVVGVFLCVGVFKRVHTFPQSEGDEQKNTRRRDVVVKFETRLHHIAGVISRDTVLYVRVCHFALLLSCQETCAVSRQSWSLCAHQWVLPTLRA